MKTAPHFINPVVFVKDIKVSKDFYTNVLKLTPVQDVGVFVLFEDHFSIHQAREFLSNALGEDSSADKEKLGSDNLLLYFEIENLDEFFTEINTQVDLIHPIQTQAWGQRVFRFYDPDRHIVEIGEPME